MTKKKTAPGKKTPKKVPAQKKPARGLRTILSLALLCAGVVSFFAIRDARSLLGDLGPVSAQWTGEVSNDWMDLRNWDVKRVPTVDWDVTIPWKPNLPVLKKPVHIHDLVLWAGSSLTLSGASLTVTGHLTSTGTILLHGNEPVSVGGWDMPGTWMYTGSSGACVVQSGIPYDNLVLNASNPATVFSLSDDLSVAHRLEVRNGTLDLAGHDLTVDTVYNEKAIRLHGTEKITVNTYDQEGNGANGMWVMTGNGNGAADTVQIQSRRWTNMVVDPRDAGETFAIEQGLSAGTLTLKGGIVDVQDAAILTTEGVSLEGGVLQLDGSLVASGSTVIRSGVLNATGAKSQVFKDLTLLGGAIKTNGVGRFTVLGNLRLLSGSFLYPSALTVSGNMEQAKGVADPRHTQVTLDGANQTLSGSLLFYDLRKVPSRNDTLQIASGSLLTVRGTLTLGTNDGHVLKLRPAPVASQWAVDVRGKSKLDHLSVQGSRSLSAKALMCVTSCLDAGHNKNWYFRN
jgi:hypothetical protein